MNYILACNHGDVRLRNGATTNEGRVEVCDGGMWGTVSHDGWSTQDAQVVCRQLNITNTYNNSEPNQPAGNACM